VADCVIHQAESSIVSLIGLRPYINPIHPSSPTGETSASILASPLDSGLWTLDSGAPSPKHHMP